MGDLRRVERHRVLLARLQRKHRITGRADSDPVRTRPARRAAAVDLQDGIGHEILRLVARRPARALGPLRRDGPGHQIGIQRPVAAAV
jgi:hypothetical protein